MNLILPDVMELAAKTRAVGIAPTLPRRTQERTLAEVWAKYKSLTGDAQEAFFARHKDELWAHSTLNM